MYWHVVFLLAMAAFGLALHQLSARRSRFSQRRNFHRMAEPPDELQYSSQAYNHISQQTRVERRTGTYNFHFTLAMLHTHWRLFSLKLQYHQHLAAMLHDPYGLGPGWTLNLPHVKTTGEHTILFMKGDKMYSILPNHGLRYYESDDLSVEIRSTESTVVLKQNGNVYTVKNGYLKTFETREGYRLHMVRNGRSLTIRNEVDEIFLLQYDEKSSSFHAKSRQTLGEVHLEIFLQKPQGVARIHCHSCVNQTGDLEFTYQPSKYLITRVDYPSGLAEILEYTQIGQTAGNLRDAVSKFTLDPGDHTADASHDNPKISVSFNYDPRKDGSNFMGDNGFVSHSAAKDYSDELMETQGLYHYYTEANDGRVCVLYQFDKFHRVVSVRTSDCQTKNLIKKISFQYDCNVRLSYSEAIGTCEKAYAVQHPKQTSLDTYGQSGSETVEWSSEIDKYGKIVEVKLPNGQHRKFEYDGPSLSGGLRYLTRMRSLPSSSMSSEEEEYIFWETKYAYKQIGKWNSNAERYTVLESVQTFYHTDPETQIPANRLLRRSSLEYFDSNEYVEHGRLKSIKESTPKTHGLQTKYSYATEGDHLRVDSEVRGIGHSKKYAAKSWYDRVTGNLVYHINVDGTGVHRYYDTHGRLVKEERLNDKQRVNSATLFQYWTQNSRNSLTVLYPDGSKTKYLMDNFGRLNSLERGQETGQYIPQIVKYYNDQNLVSRRVLGDKISTSFDYDATGKLTAIRFPSETSKHFKYDISRAGHRMYYTYLTATDGKRDAGQCHVLNNMGLLKRSCQLRTSAQPTHCNLAECLITNAVDYDSWNRPIRSKTTALSPDISIPGSYPYRDIFVKTFKYDNYGRVSSVKDELSESEQSEATFTYDDLFSKQLKVGVTSSAGFMEIVKRFLNGFGQVAEEIYSNMRSTKYYDEKGRINSASIGSSEIEPRYDDMGRHTHSAIRFKEGGKQVTDHIEWKFDETDGKLTNVRSSSPTGVVSETFSYERLHGRVSRKSSEVWNEATGLMDSYSMDHKYDFVGRNTESFDAFNQRILYKYDKAGRLVEKLYSSQQTKCATAKIILSYNIWNRIDERKYEDYIQMIALKSAYSYDVYHRLTGIDFAKSSLHRQAPEESLGKAEYFYDEFGRINRRQTTGIVEAFDYDNVNRLVKYTCEESAGSGTTRWRCPAFRSADGTSHESLFIAEQQFNYDGMNRINAVTVRANTNRELRMLYTYQERSPLMLDQVQLLDKTPLRSPRMSLSRCGKAKRKLTEMLFRQRPKIRSKFTKSKQQKLPWGDRKSELGKLIKFCPTTNSGKQMRRSMLRQRKVKLRRTRHCSSKSTQNRRWCQANFIKSTRLRRSMCSLVQLTGQCRRRAAQRQATEQLTLRMQYDDRGNLNRMVNTETNQDFMAQSYDGMSRPYHTFKKAKQFSIYRLFNARGGISYQNSSNGAGKVFYYSGSSRVPAVQKQNGHWTYNAQNGGYVLGDYRDDQSSSEVNLLDRSATVLGQISANAVQRYSYEPYGLRSRAQNDTTSQFGFNGMFIDTEEEVLAENGRMYSAWLLQFLQRDPASPTGAGGLQGYAFGINSPIQVGDHSGYAPMMNEAAAYSEGMATAKGACNAMASGRSDWVQAKNLEWTRDLYNPSEGLYGRCGHASVGYALENLVPEEDVNTKEMAETGLWQEDITTGETYMHATAADCKNMFEKNANSWRDIDTEGWKVDATPHKLPHGKTHGLVTHAEVLEAMAGTSDSCPDGAQGAFLLSEYHVTYAHRERSRSNPLASDRLTVHDCQYSDKDQRPPHPAHNMMREVPSTEQYSFADVIERRRDHLPLNAPLVCAKDCRQPLSDYDYVKNDLEEARYMQRIMDFQCAPFELAIPGCSYNR